MWTPVVLISIGASAVIGAVIGFLFSRAQSQRSIATVESELAHTQQQLDTQKAQYSAVQQEQQTLRESLTNTERQETTLKTQLEGKQQQLSEQKLRAEELEAKLEQLRTEYHSLNVTHTRQQEAQEKQEEYYQAQLKELKEARAVLTKDFENIANKIFEEKGKTFTSTSKESIDVLLKPFREQIEGFQKRINEVHESSVRGNSNLTSELKKVLDIGLKMSEEANNLTSALKGDSQQRGAWGEAQLERTLEMGGLQADIHYEKQSSFRDAEGKHKQTDYLIKLPDNKQIIIDSKVTMVAYEKAVSAESPEEYNAAMVEHVKAVKRHIDDLASKDYTNVIGMRSPSFVLMFMPIEPAYIEALKQNKELFEYGYRKNIVLVSHTTLIPILRTVSNLWMMDKSTSEAREISEKAGEIFNQVCLVAERLQKLGRTLNTVSNHYNDTVTAVAGQQGLYGKVDRFNQLSVKVSKSLPDMSTYHADHDVEKLSLVVEALPDEDEKLEEKPDEKSD
ncbi:MULTISPECIES: DNA recombination protein RmuC [Gammaproteobacteria]|uniref:DNA recombination protein RmuC n=1 Tax=Gammaproteobacteria TaxID=1236 RepID=UPI000DD02691|nr:MULTISPECIES: DNA recombination protein RmuC [Gammaproteobacteria]RTE86909.1 DNA recombination protein RmuC [Aliidiomarina sp. B3213]TCZ93301.1 DNA recombination protein RmuC [Lysobacter sp. N42]